MKQSKIINALIMQDIKKERQFEIAKDWVHAGRRCVVIKIKINVHIKSMFPLGYYHNGYVQVFPDEGIKITDSHGVADYNHWNSAIFNLCEEITFGDNLKFVGINSKNIFIGFDTAHHWNTMNPKTQRKRYVAKRCELLAEQLNSYRNNQIEVERKEMENV